VLPALLYVGAVGTVLALIDVEHHRLPDKLTLPSYPIVAALLLIPAAVTGQWGEYGRAWLGALVMVGFYFALALIYPGGMGMGDVKLSGVLGLGLGYLGWAYVVVGLFAAFLLGSVIGVALMIFGKAGRKTAIPFGPFMIAGSILAMVFAQDLVDWYLKLAVGI
jgi:leader peptidase (prepilin peptidase)/N-methyltransferase